MSFRAAGGPVPAQLEFPVRTIEVRPWPDPVIDEIGFDPRSAYVERYWLGILGPSATWLVRCLATGLEAEPAGFELDVADSARCLGLGSRAGRNSPYMRTLDRICQFGAAQRVGDGVLRARRKLAPLTRSQLARLPERLQADHERWVARPAAGSRTSFEHLRQRARRLALSLLELGEDVEATERQLHRWRMHPAVAREATAWAFARHRAAEAAAAELGADQPTPAA
jgi:hypothetical protein